MIKNTVQSLRVDDRQTVALGLRRKAGYPIISDATYLYPDWPWACITSFVIHYELQTLSMSNGLAFS